MTAFAHRLPTIRTSSPARLDRLPWSRFHSRVVAGLEVTIVGSIGARLAQHGNTILLDRLTPESLGSSTDSSTNSLIRRCRGACERRELT